MTMPWYASAEQVMRDRSEYARKGIARGRSVVVLTYVDGVVFVAENPSTALHKVSEIYDRIGYAAVGRYNEYDNLRSAGVRYADLRGYSYDRRDVTGRALANVYSQTLGAIFTEQQKPFEVEICVAEVGDQPADDQLYRLSYDGSIADPPDFVVLGGQAESIATTLHGSHRREMPLREAVALAVRALSAVGGENGKPRELTAAQLETLWPSRVAATPGMLAAAVSAWDALRQPDPSALAAFATAGVAELPFLGAALRRLLEELPAPKDGLSGTERRALQAIAAGAATPLAVFHAAQDLEAAPFLGDAWFYRTLTSLGRGQARLIETPDGEQLAAAPPLGDARAFATMSLRLTPAGERVLQQKADRVQLLGVDRWIAGSHITPGTAWRWDPAAQHLLTTA